MYAIFKSDLNTQRAELSERYPTTYQRWSQCQRTRRSTRPNANVPLILLTHSGCVEKQRASRREPGASTTLYPLHPAEI